MLQNRKKKRIALQLAFGASVLVILVTLSTFVAAADDCGKNPDLWFPPTGTSLEDGVSEQDAPSPVCQGNIITITVTVDNLTCGDAGPFDVALYYDQVDNTHLIDTQRVDAGLEACEYVVLTFTWDTTGIAPGEHSIIAWADIHLEVDEINEDNNEYTLPDTVIVRPFAPSIEAEKTYRDENGGSPMPGDTITYEIMITNDGCEAQGDNPGHEFTDVIPQHMAYVPNSVSATSGTASIEQGKIVWDGEIPVGGVITITFQTVIDANTPNQTTICNQGHVHWDSNVDGTNDADEPTDDPATPVDDDPTCLVVVRPLPSITAEKTYATESGGSAAVGDVVTYKILIKNNGDADQQDNPGHEFVDQIPRFMDYVPGSVTASSGVAKIDGNSVIWDGKITSSGTITITFQVTINNDTPDQTTICNQGIVHWDSTGDGSNDSQQPTDNPSTVADDDPTCLTVVKHPPAIDAKKRFIDENGSPTSPGDIITYDITLYNRGQGCQENNPGHEFIDPIPGFMSYIPDSVTASSGTAEVDGDQVVWDGEIAAGGLITITFKAKIDKDAEDGQEICNQGHVHWDSNADGTNDADEPTDDPSTAIDDDPTCFTVKISDEPALVGTIDAPTLSEWAQITMSILIVLSFAAMLIARRKENGAS